MMEPKSCIRCGSKEHLEEHHIIERLLGGSNEPENLEWRCYPCHKFEHLRRNIEWHLEWERKRGQANRISTYQRRLDALVRFNTVELIRERGTYLPYWTDTSVRILPRLVPTKLETELDRQLEMALSEAMAVEAV